MSQLGWVVAFARTHSGSSLHLRASSAASISRKAPPLAVSTTLRIPPGGTPCRAWKMAECSESAGVMVTPYSSSRGRITGPPAMRVSLFASAIRFFFLIASMVGKRPAQPTMPVTTTPASSSVATALTPSAPPITSMPELTPRSTSLSFSSETLDSSPQLITLTVSLNSTAWSASRSRLPPADSAVTLNLSGRALTMSRVWVPMEPVDPISEMAKLTSSSPVSASSLICFHAESDRTGAAIGWRLGSGSVPMAPWWPCVPYSGFFEWSMRIVPVRA
mmetsp:Transcript_27927/g.65007  ORF Transcript_27927/g.65007 Transcript_27927/m.65007 type:complete len:276 (-) Transcript_27927:124-951(-)